MRDEDTVKKMLSTLPWRHKVKNFVRKMGWKRVDRFLQRWWQY